MPEDELSGDMAGRVEATAAAIEHDRSDRADAVESERSEREAEVEATRRGRAVGLESDRSQRAAGLASGVVDTAAGVEADRQGFAEVVEADRLAREETVEEYRIELAKWLERDRKLHNLRMEERWRARTKVVNRRFWFLFAALALAFVFLAWRSELNQNAIRDGLHTACLARQNTSQQSRDALMVMAMAPRVPPRTEKEMQASRDAIDLLLPIEECDPPVT